MYVCRYEGMKIGQGGGRMTFDCLQEGSLDLTEASGKRCLEKDEQRQQL